MYVSVKIKTHTGVTMKAYTQINIIVTVAMAAVIATSWAAAESVAQDEKLKTPLTWKDLGFNGFPEGLSTDEIVLIESLNKGRGVWSFEGSASRSGGTTPIQGKLAIMGSAKNGMIPMWQMSLGWPHEDPQDAINYIVMVAPERTRVEIMLIRMGPMKIGPDGEPLKDAVMKARRTPFEGTWNLKSRTVLWKEREMPGNPTPQQQEPATKEKASFEMVFAATGEITLQNPKNTDDRLDIAGKVAARIGKPLAEEKLAFNKDIRYDAYADISEPHVKQCLPPNAVEITLRLERGGHFARYKVSEKDFHNFLDDLWQTEESTSAHPRDQRGKGKAVDPKQMAGKFDRLGWKPLKKAIRYYSPSKRNGAITTYLYDCEAGVAYHERGYW